MKKISSAIIVSILIFLCSAPTFGATFFADVTGHWAESNIYAAAEADIIHGYPDGTFHPDRQISRAEFITILAFESGEAIGGARGENFSDAEGHWAKDYILWGKENNILSGYEDNTFRPDRSISRQEMASVLYRYITNYCGKDIREIAPKITFADDSDISFWAKEAVDAMQISGIINGKGNNLFDPLAGATRAETTVMLNRFITYYRTDDVTFDSAVTIYFNDQQKQTDVPIFKQNGTEMIPIRSLLESAGFEVRFYPEPAIVLAYRYDRDMEFWLNETSYYNNGNLFAFSVSPALISGTTCVPLKETAAAAGLICQFKDNNGKTEIHLTGGYTPVSAPNSGFFGTANPVFGTASLRSADGGFWGTIKNGEMHYGCFVFDNGETYFGNWQNGMLNGQGRSLNQYGEFFVGTFQNNAKQAGTVYYTDGSQFIGSFTKTSANVIYPAKGQYIAADGTVYGSSDTAWSSGSLPQSKW